MRPVAAFGLMLMLAACSGENQQNGTEAGQAAQTASDAQASAASTNPAPALASACPSGQEVMFACSAGAEQISICTDGRAITLRSSGGPGGPLNLVRQAGGPDLYSWTEVGGGVQGSLRFTEGQDEHVIWSGTRGSATGGFNDRSGVKTFRDGQVVSSRDCTATPTPLNLSPPDETIKPSADPRYQGWFMRDPANPDAAVSPHAS